LPNPLFSPPIFQLFKSLLFFGAGAVLNATGERDMERLGGLIHHMPQTAFVFLAGCIPISAGARCSSCRGCSRSWKSKSA
jgi:hydrogenase-4 component B